MNVQRTRHDGTQTQCVWEGRIRALTQQKCEAATGRHTLYRKTRIFREKPRSFRTNQVQLEWREIIRSFRQLLLIKKTPERTVGWSGSSDEEGEM